LKITRIELPLSRNHYQFACPVWRGGQEFGFSGYLSRLGQTTRRRALASALAAVTVLALAACGSSGSSPPSGGPSSHAPTLQVTTIGYALSGPADDGGFYQDQAQEITKLGHQLGIKVIVDQNADPNSAAVLGDLARQGAQVVIVDGSEFTPAMLAFAADPSFSAALPLMVSGDPPVNHTYATAGRKELRGSLGAGFRRFFFRRALFFPLRDGTCVRYVSIRVAHQADQPTPAKATCPTCRKRTLSWNAHRVLKKHRRTRKHRDNCPECPSRSTVTGPARHPDIPGVGYPVSCSLRSRWFLYAQVEHARPC